MQSILVKRGSLRNIRLKIPGDKSITHRALIISAISNHNVLINNWLASLDCIATANALAALGVNIRYLPGKTVEITGVGLHGLQPPKHALDLANSGTGLRLLTGILAAQKFDSVITGDSSLCKRPMARIIEPLTEMGAKIIGTNKNFAPLIISGITGSQQLKSINYVLPVASAQVKSAILLADLYAGNRSAVTETVPSRNHTELMLEFFKQNLDKNKITVNIPGDISSAAFFVVAACIVPNSRLELKNIGINPTRTGIIKILLSMGADIAINNIQEHNHELSADLIIKTAKLTGIDVPFELVPNAIDEFPILAIAAACAKGITRIRGASELRHKETDRIAAIAQGLTNIGIKNTIYPDGLDIIGGKITGGKVNSYGDHRIAMAFAIAGLVAEQGIMVQDTQNIATSFPGFEECLKQCQF